MRARLALHRDKDAVLALAQAGAEEAHPEVPFDSEVAWQTWVEAMTTGHPVIFIVEHAGEVFGILSGFVQGYQFARGLFVAQEVIYVRPDKRGSRAAALLVAEFIKWGELMDARQIMFSITSGIRPDSTARFFSRFGAKQVGHTLILNRTPAAWA